MRLSVPLGGGVRWYLDLPVWLLLLAFTLGLGLTLTLIAFWATTWGLYQVGRGIAFLVAWAVRWWRRFPDMPTRLANLPWPPQSWEV